MNNQIITKFLCGDENKLIRGFYWKKLSDAMSFGSIFQCLKKLCSCNNIATIATFFYEKTCGFTPISNSTLESINLLVK